MAVQGLGAIWPPSAARVIQTSDYSTTRKHGPCSKWREENYRHEGTMGVNTDVLRLLVRPGGAGMVVCLSSLLARADAVRRNGGFDPKLLYSQDSEFMFRLAMHTQFLLCQPSAGLVRPIARGNSPCGSELGLEQSGILASRIVSSGSRGSCA